jgi:predicted DsbA family dithiol-disulfide isomerase
MRRVLFENPQKLDVAYLPAHAATLSLDLEAFNACLQSNRHLDEIAQDAKDAKSVKLTGTPSFIIGKSAKDEIFGQVVVGAQPMNKFEAAIQAALAQASAKKNKPAKNADAKVK